MVQRWYNPRWALSTPFMITVLIPITGVLKEIYDLKVEEGAHLLARKSGHRGVNDNTAHLVSCSWDLCISFTEMKENSDYLLKLACRFYTYSSTYAHDLLGHMHFYCYQSSLHCSYVPWLVVYMCIPMIWKSKVVMLIAACMKLSNWWSKFPYQPLFTSQQWWCGYGSTLPLCILFVRTQSLALGVFPFQEIVPWAFSWKSIERSKSSHCAIEQPLCSF